MNSQVSQVHPTPSFQSCSAHNGPIFTPADPYHSYLAIAALAMTDNDEASAEKGSLGLVDLDPVWNVSRATKTWLEGVLRGIRHP